MIYSMYSVLDNLTGKYFAPVMMMNDEEAKRQFKGQVNNIQLWKDNPSDFDLWKLGTFEEETGMIDYNPEKICGGRSVLNV